MRLFFWNLNLNLATIIDLVDDKEAQTSHKVIIFGYLINWDDQISIYNTAGISKTSSLSLYNIIDNIFPEANVKMAH